MIEIRKGTARVGPRSAYVGQLLIASVLNSGPWSLLLAAFFSFYIASEPWAPSFFMGALAWLVFLSAAVAIKLSRRRKQNNNAA